MQAMFRRPLFAAALLTTAVAMAISVIVLVDVMWEMAFWSSGFAIG